MDAFPTDEVIQSRLDHIREVMEQQGLKGNPRKHIVLHGWDRITDWDREYEIVLPPLPQPVPVGMHLWVIERSDSPDLVEAIVMEDRGDKLWVKHGHKDVEFQVWKDDVKTTPIPFHRTAVLRRELHRYLGKETAKKWHDARAVRLERWNHAG